ncbi:MAG: patatin-like phospholipase family protein [Thermoanaerobaculia bacterium]|nr:patatin-like phospholipase family protein [Thermoanaerobaculia bacterium]
MTAGSDTASAPTGRPPGGGGIALALTGGGARAAYQVGFLRCLARRLPRAGLPILTGVSAGAINAAYLAARSRSLPETVESLSQLWRELTPERIFEVGRLGLFWNAMRWAGRLLSGGGLTAPRARSLVDTTPLRRLIEAEVPAGGEIQGIQRNIDSGRLTALALSTVNYATGQTVTWVQGSEIQDWERPNRLGVQTQINTDHIMASAALPLLFPAVRIGDAWYGDGGIRMFAPLSPAIRLGADRILAISTRYRRSREEAAQPATRGYPPVAQVAGTLLNAIFLDAIDHDAARLTAINAFLDKLSPEEWGRWRKVRLLVLRPSQDLGRLAAKFEPKLPKGFRFMTRGLGTRDTESPDVLSLLMFQSDYTSALIEIGERDAEARADEIGELLAE